MIFPERVETEVKTHLPFLPPAHGEIPKNTVSANTALLDTASL